MPPADAEAAAAAICALLVQTCVRATASVALYAPLPGEPDLRPAALEFLRLGVPLYLPRCLPDSSLAFARVEGWEDLRPGRLGILEPPGDAPVASLALLGSVVVPGVAFDLAGYRLGRGAGYYDRTFSGAIARPDLVGVAFDWQLVERLPREEHDVPMARVITDRRSISPAAAPSPAA